MKKEAVSKNDDFVVDVPDIPMPEGRADSEIVSDECQGAFRFAFVGAGQAGCLSGSTNVYISGLGILPIKKAFDQAFAEAMASDITVLDGGHIGVKLHSGNYHTLSINPSTGVVCKRRVLAVWKNVATKPKRIQMPRGCYLDCSITHPTLIFRRDKRLLRNGLFFRTLEGSNKTDVGDRAVMLDAPAVDLGISTFIRGIAVTDDVAWIFGVFAGDGSLKSDANEVSFYCDSPAVRDRVVKLGGLLGATSVSVRPKIGCWKVSYFGLVSSSIFRSAFEYDGGAKFDTVGVPRCVSAATSSIRVAFIAGLLASDGTVSDRWCEASITTCSKGLADALSCLLYTLGGRCSVYCRKPSGKGKHQTYQVKISGLDQFGPVLSALIGQVTHERKVDRLRRWQKNGQKSFSGSLAPICFDEVRDWLSEGGYTTTNDMEVTHGLCLKSWVRGENKLSRPMFRHLLECLKETNDIARLESLVGGIEEIESISDTEVDGFYDLSVEEYENYFAGNFGMIATHNSRMAESFWKLGYRRVCCVNTNKQDLAAINIPDANKLVMDIGSGGAGKDPAKGAAAAKQYYEDIYDLMRRSFGKQFDRIFIVCGAGGGTGSGSTGVLIDIAHDIAQSFKIEDASGVPAVGAIVALPKGTEGSKVNENAHALLSTLFAKVGHGKGKADGRTLSPLIVVDNDKIEKIYPNLPVTQFWDVANRSVSALLHLFNNIAVQDSDYTTFDRADLQDLLSSGVVSFGACPIPKWDNMTDISHAIRDNLKNNVLAGGFDTAQARAAGCVFIGNPDVLAKIPQAHLEHGFEMLTRMMRQGGTLHRGIYKGSKAGLVVYSMLGELGKPEEKMAELARIGQRR